MNVRYSITSATTNPTRCRLVKQINTLNQWRRYVARYGQLKPAVERGMVRVGPALRRKLRNA